MSTATSGRAREHKVRDMFVRHGWTPIFRAAGSKGPADIGLAHPIHGLALIQVGTGNKTLGPAERERLCHAAELCGALALLATVIPRPGKPSLIRIFEVTRGKPATWPEWSHA